MGARPQFIKAAAVSSVIRNEFKEQIREKILHTGQHYDPVMSKVFFDELEIPQPDFHFNTGSGLQGEQTANILIQTEKIFESEKPDAVVVYGDTNSTLAGAIAASKMHIPVIHIEAGLRSYRKQMPEEINRILTDHVSSLLCCPTATSIENLKKEGIFHHNEAELNHPAVCFTGDVMFDIFLQRYNGNGYPQNINAGEPFILATLHRASNTDNLINLKNILSAFAQVINAGYDVILPLHPRTRKQLELLNDVPEIKNLLNNSKFKITEPVSYLSMLSLLKHATLVMTDAGGLQKEAFFSKKPCVILRDETEWKELIENNVAVIGGTTTSGIASAFHSALNLKISDKPELYGNGNASLKICEAIVKYFSLR